MNFNFLQLIKGVIFQKLLKIIFIGGVAFLINKTFQVLLEKALENKIKEKIDHEKRIKTLFSVIRGTLKFIIWIVAILMILPEFGINIIPVLTSLGLVGFALGMAAKDILSDFISGIFIILEDQYRVGDKVKISGIEGEVVEVTLRKTVVKDEQGFFHFIPNSQIKLVAKKND